MYYYYFADMESLRMNVREALENIFIILNKKWNFEEKKETKKMLKMFENPESILSEVMSIKEIDISSKRSLSMLDLSEEEKRQGILKNPEEWVADMKDEPFCSLLRKSGPNFFDDTTFEKIKVLAKFVLKMAVYRFCTMHFPKIMKSFQQYARIDIEPLENELEEWEKQFWTVWVSHSVEVNIYVRDSIAQKRAALRNKYSNRELKLRKDSREEQDMWDYCILKAFKDIDTLENVKELRQNCIGEKLSGSKKENYSNDNESADILRMKHLLDILDRHRKGRLSEGDVTELKENSESWSKDIEALRKMIDGLNI